MRILLTGAAGFIGYHVASRLVQRGDTVLGLDSLNSYYSVDLKRARLADLERSRLFEFLQVDISDPMALVASTEDKTFDAIIHLAAQAGVRYSLENPYAYVDSNVTGQVAVFEFSALRGRIPVVYASSSSVYGCNEKVPFSESDRVDSPVSVYAATKRAGELLAHAYMHTRGIPSTGLRFFTVYGRYGRPDMAPWLFTDALLNDRPITVYNSGHMERDFTHVSDIVGGVVAATDRIVNHPNETSPIYNLGNHKPVRLMDFIRALENATQRRAQLEMKPKPPGDVLRTFADISLATQHLAFSPRTTLADGLADFVCWFRDFHGYQ